MGTENHAIAYTFIPRTSMTAVIVAVVRREKWPHLTLELPSGIHKSVKLLGAPPGIVEAVGCEIAATEPDVIYMQGLAWAVVEQRGEWRLLPKC